MAKIKFDGRDRYIRSLSKLSINKYIKGYVIESFGAIAKNFQNTYRDTIDGVVPQSFHRRTQDVFELLEQSVDSCFKSFATVIDIKDNLEATIGIIMSKYERYAQVYSDALCKKLYEMEEFSDEDFSKELDRFIKITNENIENTRKHIDFVFTSRFERKQNGKKAGTKQKGKSDGSTTDKSKGKSTRVKTGTAADKKATRKKVSE